MSNQIGQDFERQVKQNVPLAGMTTLGIGGAARYFAVVSTAAEISAGVLWARSRALPLFVLGGGSNVLVSDTGFNGLVLKMNLRGVSITEDGQQVTVKAAAGEEWDRLAAELVSRNFAGVECLSGIPGLVGATPIQNVGAYGQEIAETLVSVDAVEMSTGRVVSFSRIECQFGYRSSRFKTSDLGRFIITGVYYRLVKNGTPAIRYPELQKYLAQAGKGAPDLAQAREAVLSIRRKKAMLIDSSDPDSRSAGSFFMNPIVTPEVLDQIRQRSHLRDAVRDMPVFGTDDGNWKLSAGWLIEAAGFKRGHVAGGVGLSSKHPLAIVNRGGGTAREVIQLVDQIRSHVFDAFGVLLVTEPVFVGFDESLGEKRGSVSSGLGSTMRESAELGAWFDEE